MWYGEPGDANVDSRGLGPAPEMCDKRLKEQTTSTQKKKHLFLGALLLLFRQFAKIQGRVATQGSEAPLPRQRPRPKLVPVQKASEIEAGLQPNTGRTAAWQPSTQDM